MPPRKRARNQRADQAPCQRDWMEGLCKQSIASVDDDGKFAVAVNLNCVFRLAPCAIEKRLGRGNDSRFTLATLSNISKRIDGRNSVRAGKRDHLFQVFRQSTGITRLTFFERATNNLFLRSAVLLSAVI